MNPREISRREFLERAGGAGLLIAAGGLLASCGGGSGEAAPTSSQESAVSSGASADTAAPPPPRGGTLRIGMSGGSTSDSLDAHIQASNTDGARGEQLYDHLAIRDPQFAIKPTLAEEFSPNSTADEWTVRLRDGVECHDGKTLDADDLIFTVQRILDPKTEATQASTLSFIDPNGMTKVDARTVRFKLVAPCAIFEELWTPSVYIVPAGYDPANPVGTGPFRYVSFTPGQESTFERFENYWGGPTSLDSVVMTDYTDDNARINALLSNQVDAIDSIPYAQLPVIEKNDSLEVLSAEPGEWRPLTMNVTAEPFVDNRVRQAFRLLADRELMLEQALAGRGRIANDLYAPQDPAYASDLPQREYDPEQAKALLKEAGQEGVTVELVTSPVKGGLVEACQVFAQSAKAGGVTVDVKKVDPSVIYGDQYLKWPFAVDYWPTKSYLLTASNTDGPNAELNETNFHDDEFNSLYNSAFAEVDESKRNVIIRDMQQIQYDRGGYIIWAFPDQFDAYSGNATGFVAGLSGEPFGNWDLKAVTVES